MSELVLRIGGQDYAGWTRMSVRRSMQDLAGSFDLEVTERWLDSPAPRRIAPGDACQILIDGEPVITGYVDATPVDYDAGSHRISVQGRDRTGDLVDSSAPTLQWVGRSLAQMAEKLCKAFGIAVVDEAKASRAFTTYKPGDGETVFETLDKGARFRGVLLTTDGEGRLVISRVGAARATDALELGRNILQASGSFDLRDCFSLYTVKGQGAGDLEESCAVLARARDSRITRHRPIILMCDGPADNAAARDKAVWERNVRAGRSQSVNYTVLGWRQASGALWRPNLLVRVRDAYQHMDTDMLITDVVYSLDDGRGEVCELTVMPPVAFALKAEPEPDAEAADDGL